MKENIWDFAEAVMTETAGFCACALIASVDIAAGVLGLLADQIQRHKVGARLYEEEKKTSVGCREWNGRKMKLGVAAATLLALGHVSSNLLGACVCCICGTHRLESSSLNRKFYFGCLVLSWVVAAAGFPILLMRAIESSKLGGSCRILDDQQHFFYIPFIGGVFCFMHGIFTLSFYLSAVFTFRHGRSSPLVRQP